VHAAKSYAKCALKDNLLTSVGTATLTSYSDDITVSKRSEGRHLPRPSSIQMQGFVRIASSLACELGL